MPVIHVTLFGQHLVWLKNDISNEGPLAYPEHVDENGHVTIEAGLSGLSYAHVGNDGTIKRRHNVIGTVADLVLLDRSTLMVALTATEFTLRGGKAIRYVATAIAHEIELLNVIANDPADENAQADALNDIGFYEAILADMVPGSEAARHG